MAGSIDTALDSLLLQVAEEQVPNRVVPAVLAPTHAGHQEVVCAPEAELITAELAALIGVNHHGILSVTQSWARCATVSSRCNKFGAVVGVMPVL